MQRDIVILHPSRVELCTVCRFLPVQGMRKAERMVILQIFPFRFMKRMRIRRDRTASVSYTHLNSGSSAESDREKAAEKAKGKTYDTVWVKVQDVGKVQEIAQTIRDAGFSTY